MKHINNSNEIVVVLKKRDIEQLMAICNSASLRWLNKYKETKDYGWTHMKEMADEYWDKMYTILNPEKEV